MLATAIHDFRRAIIERVDEKRIKKERIEEYQDISIELRRYLAAEIASRDFERYKDRALTESHRASFMR